MARFAPADAARRHALREQYGVADGAQVILHAGHINRNRNVQILAALAGLENAHVILAGSSSTRQDTGLIEELQAAGVSVYTTYNPRVEELYQLADLYVFPPSPATSPDETPAIEVPLSVLEAMACDLPVVATCFGGLPAMFEEGEGLFYVNDPADSAEWQRKVREGLSAGRGHTRHRVAPHSWQNLVDVVLGEHTYAHKGSHRG